MAAKKKSAAKKQTKAKGAAKKGAKKGAAKKGAKKGAAKKGAKKGAAKKAAKKGAAKKATKKAPAKKAAAKKAPAKKGVGHVIASAPRRAAIDVSSAYKGDNLDHHPVSRRDLEEVRSEGLRGDGEILHVEESEFTPCRLVDHGEERFSLCFDDFRMPEVPLFKERGLQGGGYTWEAVVASLVKQRHPELERELNYDSEAGMFVALGSREALRAVAGLIQDAIGDPALLREALDHADPDRLE